MSLRIRNLINEIVCSSLKCTTRIYYRRNILKQVELWDIRKGAGLGAWG